MIEVEEKEVVRHHVVYRDGVLYLAEPLDLAAGTEVQVTVRLPQPPIYEQPAPPGLAYPTRSVSVEWIKRLVGTIPVGGDALADSETLWTAQ